MSKLHGTAKDDVSPVLPSAKNLALAASNLDTSLEIPRLSFVICYQKSKQELGRNLMIQEH